MILLLMCLALSGKTKKIEAAIQSMPESRTEEKSLDGIESVRKMQYAVSGEQKEQQKEEQTTDRNAEELLNSQNALLEEFEFDAIQKEVDQLLSDQEFSFAGTVRSLLREEDPFRSFRAGNAVLSCAKTAFLAQKELVKELFLLVLAGAVLGNFASLFEGKQVRDTGFYMVYLLALKW